MDWLSGVDLIIPVPPNPQRLKESGFDIVCEFASFVGRLIKIPIEHRLILRGKCGAQKGGSRSERIESAEQLYTVRKLPSQLLGKSVLLMDDVRTSGATTDTISRLLVEAGISNVRIWTLSGTARAPKELGN
jgi:predicted amidophosphoribosyltransferase